MSAPAVNNKHPFMCEHLVFRHECEECSLTSEELAEFMGRFKRYWQKLCVAHKARLKAANEELKAQESPGAGGRRKIRFQLDDLPAPIKQRELLYRDYHRGGHSLVDQWCSRLEKLHHRTDEWWRELTAMVHRRLGITDATDDHAATEE